MHPEDLTPGQLVTVFKGPRMRLRNGKGEAVGTQENAALNGSVLRVLGLSLPYVAVEVLYSHHEQYGVQQRIGLDTRDIEFVRIDGGYARALSRVKLEQVGSGGMVRGEIPRHLAEAEEHETPSDPTD